MCNSKCFAKPQKMSLMDILSIRGHFGLEKDLETEVVNLKLKDGETQTIALLKSDLEFLEKIKKVPSVKSFSQ